MDAGLQLKRINDKLQDLLKKYELLQKENDKLRNELLPAKQREIGFMEQISILEQKIMVLKTNVGKMDETDRKELDKKLHGYLKEIDRCISMLSE
jgi:predicted  nucleic acid-binding Zn-ribbon protein